MHAGAQFGDGRQVLRPKVVHGGERNRAFELRGIGFERRLAPLLQPLSLALYHRFVPDQKLADLQILPFHQALDALGVVAQARVFDAMANQQIVFERQRTAALARTRNEGNS